MVFKLSTGRAPTAAAEWARPMGRELKSKAQRRLTPLSAKALAPELPRLGHCALPWVRNAVHRSSSMNEAPDDGAQRAQPEKDGGRGLNPKASPAFIGGLRIAGHVKNAAGDPDEAQHRRDCVADVDREQP